MELLRLEGLSKRYIGTQALDAVDMTIEAGQVLCLAGANGSGKSTLMKCIAGGETPETFKPFGVGVIDLEGVVRIESRLTESDPDKLEFGGKVELVIVPFRTDGDTEIVSFAFKPV